MKLSYNVTGENRKQMVAVISQVASVCPVYTRMPECAFLVGDIKVSKTGEMIWDERTDEELIGRVMEALSMAGFSAEEDTATHQAEDESTGVETETHEAEDAETQEAGGTETQGTERARETVETQGAGDLETTGLIISFPIDGGSNGVAITEAVLENLRKLIASKAALIQKALKVDRLTVERTDIICRCSMS